MVRPSDTKQRIQAVAKELFAQHGVQKTSLQAIADRLGITKPALYYHFSSREDLVRSIVQPVIDDGEAFVQRYEEMATVDPEELFAGYFDYYYERRDEMIIVLTELATLTELGMIEHVLAWRERLARLLVGPTPTLEVAARATVALGGLQDCTVAFRDVPQAELRDASVAAACAALGIR